MKLTKKQQEAKTFLRRTIHGGSTIFVRQNSVSGSGMTRRLSLYVSTRKGGYMQMITGAVSDLIGWSFNDKGLKVDGFGMDMHLHTVDILSSYLFPKGSKKFGGNGGNCLKFQSL